MRTLKLSEFWLAMIATVVMAVACVKSVAAEPAKQKPAAAPAGTAQPRTPPGEDPPEYAARPDIFPFVPVSFTSAALSPDEKWIAAGTGDWTNPGDLLLWDSATRRLKLQQHLGQGVWRVAFSPDSALVAVGTFAGELILVDVTQAKLVTRWKPHTGIVQAIVFSPDGKLLASASADASVKLWEVSPPVDANAGLPLRALFDAHANGVLTAAFAPDGKNLYTGGRDQKVIVWDVLKPRKVAAWENIDTPPQNIAISPDGETVAVALWNGTVQVRQRSDGSVLSTLDHNPRRGMVMRVSFAQKSPLLATAGRDGTIKIWDLPAGTLRTTINTQAGPTWAAELTADGGRFLTAGADGLVRMWDAATTQEVFRLRADAGIEETESPIVGSAWSRDGLLLATAHADDSIRLRETKTGHTVKIGAAPAELLGVLALSPDGRQLVGAGEDRALYLWDVSAEIGVPILLRGHAARITGVVFSPDGQSIYSAATDGSVRQWDASSGSPGRVLDAGKDRLLCLACAEDGRWLAAAGHGRIVHLWNLADAATRPVLSLGGHAGAVAALAFAPDRRALASAGDDKNVFLWDLTGLDANGDPPQRRGIFPRYLTTHQEPVQCLAISPHGKWVASGSLDKTVRLSATDPAAAVQTLTTTAFIQSLAFDAGASRMLAVGSDRTLGVWHGSHGIPFPATEGRYLRLKALSEVNGQVWTTIAEIRVYAGETQIATRDWKLVSADSEESDTPGSFAFDGNPRTFWGTRWRSGATRHPHEIVIDLGQAYRLTGFSVLPRQDGNPNGTIKDYELYLGNDPQKFGPPVLQGQMGIGTSP